MPLTVTSSTPVVETAQPKISSEPMHTRAVCHVAQPLNGLLIRSAEDPTTSPERREPSCVDREGAPFLEALSGHDPLRVMRRAQWACDADDAYGWWAA